MMFNRSGQMLITLLLSCWAVPAQATLKEIEEAVPTIKLATKIDAKGKKQWDAFPHQNCPACKASKVQECLHCDWEDGKPQKCPECNLTRKAPCYVCAGRGNFANPLEWSPCPGCRGHAWFSCYLCGNSGRIHFVGGGKKGEKCSLCAGEAGMKCGVCSTKRLVPSAFGGKVGTRKLAKLDKTRKNLLALIAKVDAFKCQKNPRKDKKAFAALFKRTRRDFPVLKKLVKQVEVLYSAKGLDQHIKDIERTQMYAFDAIRHFLLYYLIHERRVLDLCIERAKFNDAPPKKGG